MKAFQLIGLFLLTAAAGVGLWLYFRRQSQLAAPAFARPERDFGIASSTGVGASGFTAGSVAGSPAGVIEASRTVGGTVIPSTSRNYYTVQEVGKLLSDSLPAIRSRYGVFIQQAARNSDVPVWLIEAKLLIENASGNARLRSSADAIGLMQIKKLSATEHVVIARQKGLLSPAEIAVLQRRLGATKMSRILQADNTAQIITEADLMDAELNIQLGAIYLSVYLEECREGGGGFRWDKIAARYTRGYYAYNRGRDLATASTTDALLKKLDEERTNYVLKLVGQNGLAQNLIA